MTQPALLLIGHGSRDVAGVEEYWSFTRVLQAERPDLPMGFGFIELAEPDLDTAVDDLVAAGARSIIGVPLVLLGAGHMKNDGPACLARGRERHPDVAFTYGTDLGVHPNVLDVAAERFAGADAETAVLLVGRGSSDPDANADLHKAARLLWEGRGAGWVEPSFVSLAPPSVPEGLDRCRRLGARRVVVVPYFLFTGVLVERIGAQAAAWAAAHPEASVEVAPHLGADRRIARLVLERYEAARAGTARTSCDCCIYRVALPGHEHKVGQPVRAHAHTHAPVHVHDPVHVQP